MKATYFYKILPFFILLTFISSCGSDEDPGPSGTVGTTPPRTADDVRADFQALTINPGVNDLVLESIVAGVYWNFRIIAPADASSTNKRPMIMRLHGGASEVTEYYKNTGCLAEPGLASLNAYIVSPNSDGSLWYANQNVVQVQALVDLVQTYLHVDTSKVAVMGYSDGGNGSWFFSQYLPQLFSAAIPMASSYAVTTTSGVTHQFAKPIYAIHGENDQLFPLATTQGYVNETVDAGSDVTFVIADGLEHYNSCNYVSYLQDAASWLENTVWN